MGLRLVSKLFPLLTIVGRIFTEEACLMERTGDLREIEILLNKYLIVRLRFLSLVDGLM